MTYSPLTERHFRSPSNAGSVAGSGGRVVRGEAGSSAEGLHIVFEARVEAGRLLAIAFRALACPHLIAACSRTTELLTGAPAEAAATFSAIPLADELGIPAEKRGRLLLLEDALRSCVAAWDTTQSTSAGARAGPAFGGEGPVISRDSWRADGD